MKRSIEIVTHRAAEADIKVWAEAWIEGPAGRVRLTYNIADLLSEEHWATLEAYCAADYQHAAEEQLEIEAAEEERARTRYQEERIERLRRVASGGPLACVHCSADDISALEVDHIIPRSRGGANRPDNLQSLCRTCNQKKGRKTMEEWLGVAP